MITRCSIAWADNAGRSPSTLTPSRPAGLIYSPPLTACSFRTADPRIRMATQARVGSIGPHAPADESSIARAQYGLLCSREHWPPLAVLGAGHAASPHLASPEGTEDDRLDPLPGAGYLPGPASLGIEKGSAS